MTIRPGLAFALSLALLACGACAHTEKAESTATTATATANPTASASTTTSPTATATATANSTATAATPAVLDEVSGCTTANDCAYTRVAAGACCPLMCNPRVVTKKRADELDKNIAVCNGGKECPLPPCRPPQADFRIACEEHKCTLKMTPLTQTIQ